MGSCIKRKIRSAKDQHERKPTSTPTTEKMIRLLNSSRCARSGIERVCFARTKTAASAMESLYRPAIEFVTVSKTGRYNQHYSQPCKSIRRWCHRSCLPVHLLSVL